VSGWVHGHGFESRGPLRCQRDSSEGDEHARPGGGMPFARRRAAFGIIAAADGWEEIGRIQCR